MEQKGCHSPRPPCSNHTIQGKGECVFCSFYRPERRWLVPGNPANYSIFYTVLFLAFCMLMFYQGHSPRSYVPTSIWCALSMCLTMAGTKLWGLPWLTVFNHWLRLCIAQASGRCACRNLACALFESFQPETEGLRQTCAARCYGLTTPLTGCSPGPHQWPPTWERAGSLSSRVRSSQRKKSD